mmetsp:Transcript_10436/g.17527  ORF Transcript_10436/g.17527 Transcript_10436/m.17527 type:complete len:118 (+) Transcript_10436:301-654(+)
MIQLLQNRRLRQDDNKGVIEVLNERDESGNGIKVTANYYMQIFDRSKSKSVQRAQQINIDQPLQYFFAFDFNQETTGSSKSANLPAFSSPEVSFQVYPLAKGQIQVRLENLADKFEE